MNSVSRNRNRPKHLHIVTPEEELENLKNEVGVLHRAVESKTEAVGILRAELQECQKERDEFRTLAEQGGGGGAILHRHRPPNLTPNKAALSDPGRSAILSGSDGTLAQLLCQAKEENRTLRQEATELRCRLHDAQADTKVMREEVQRWRGGGDGRRGSQANTALTQLALQERERFISQMEELSAKCQALEGDVRGLVEEREELVRELDATHHKLHRLNYILNTILNSPQHTSNTTTTAATATAATPTLVPPKRIVDLDGIITENRYLQQRLKQAEEEMTLARSNSSKYKSALERCRSQGSVKLGTSESLIVTPKQVSELLQEYRGEVGGLAESDLRSLCVALVDALGQRSRALRTQRSANRVLVNRVNELERRLMDQGGQRTSTSVEGSQGGEEATPADLPRATQELMEGYTPPAGRGGLALVKDEDVSRDPRLLKFLNPVPPPQPPSHPRDAGDGKEGEDGKEAELKVNVEEENRGDTDTGSKTKNIVKEEEVKINEMIENRGDTGSKTKKIVKEGEVRINGESMESKGEANTEREVKNITKEEVKIKREVDSRGDTKTGSKTKEADMETTTNKTQVENGIISNEVKNDNQITKEEEEEEEEEDTSTSGVNHNNDIEEEEEEEEEEEDVPLLPADSHYPHKYIDDDLEEIVPLDQLDAYIMEMHKNRRSKEGKGSVKNTKGGMEGKVNVKEEKKDRERRGRETEVNTEKRVNRGDRKESKDEKQEMDECVRGEAEGERIEGKELKKETETRREEKTERQTKDNQNITETGEKNNDDNNDNDDDDDDDDSIDLDLSDYDSDNDKLDLALEEWKNDCGIGKSKGGGGKGEASSPARGGKKEVKKEGRKEVKKEGRKEGFRLWRKEQKSNTDEAELPSALQAILDKATAAAAMDGSGWTT